MSTKLLLTVLLGAVGCSDSGTGTGEYSQKFEKPAGVEVKGEAPAPATGGTSKLSGAGRRAEPADEKAK